MWATCTTSTCTRPWTATFARDGERLVAAGFAARTIAAFDLMPQTAHVELVARFER